MDEEPRRPRRSPATSWGGIAAAVVAVLLLYAAGYGALRASGVMVRSVSCYSTPGRPPNRSSLQSWDLEVYSPRIPHESTRSRILLGVFAPIRWCEESLGTHASERQKMVQMLERAQR